tara:strand:+ start:44 stop:325 length:282 start_codon:yes stop_codon:yes gene_type:complete
MTNKFTFREEDSIEDKDITFTIKYDDGTPWPNVLQDFLFFLEATGYVGVRDKVRIEYSPFRESEGWFGDYYDSDEEKEDLFAWERNDEDTSNS